MSHVEHILRKDPAGVYAKMDFTTRDNYRHVIEKIAVASRCSEEHVAEAAIRLASGSPGHGNRLAHVGCFLVDRERALLEKAVHMRRTLKDRLVASGRKAPLFFYLAPILLLTSGFTLLVLWIIPGQETEITILLSILISLVTSQPALALVNWTASFLVKPRVLPRMDFREGIPKQSCTLVTIPAMLTGEPEIRELLNKLEVCYLANKAPNLFFSLITDFKDAPQEQTGDDARLFQLAKNGMEELNGKYCQGDLRPFLFFHRERRWNPRERVWMGYERKRGKLEALNRALRESQTPAILAAGDPTVLHLVKYVLTLDTDTVLPRDSARLLIETMAHPLNNPVYDSVKHRITRGYTILQPRVVSSLPAARRSSYARIFGQDFGIDPYTRAVSDVYQDLFLEGSFIGKGIYDVDMFMATLANRLPENRILSHDLLEGTYGRAGLVSDVQVVEDFPASYSEDISRRHRWIRGDWQIASWLMPRVPGFQCRSQKNPVSALSRWKIFDNLRRSIVPSGLLLFIITCWFLPIPSWLGIAIMAGIILLPVLPDTFRKAFRIPAKYPLSLHVLSSLESMVRHLIQAVFFFVVLPFEAFFNLDAIFRTAWRMLFTRRKLLEWTTSGEAKRQSCFRLRSYCSRMLVVPLLAATAIIYFLCTHGITFEMWGVLGLWFLSPALAWWTGRPLARRKAKLSDRQIAYLRKISRKTWRFFETLVTTETNWLPPDNYQEEPKEIVARMTSPTNIGLMLLSNLGAYDQGYLSTGILIDRIEKSFRTLEKLERFHGHFYNWYDVESLQALSPHYVSTVDSGNLAGYLFALRVGLQGLGSRTLFQQSTWRGLEDVLGVIEGLCLDEAHGQRRGICELQETLREREMRSTGLRETLADLNEYANRLLEIKKLFAKDLSAETDWWFQVFAEQCRDVEEEVMFLAPWLVDLQELEDTKIELLRELDANYTLDAIKEICVPEGVSVKTASKIKKGSSRALERTNRLEKLVLQCTDFAEQEYDFLFDRKRNLLTIGYNADTHRRDDSFYDLLASEARLASFIGIAKGKLPVDHWFSLGRLVLIWKGKTVLLSWGGSMFEYLMPLLVLPAYQKTLLEQSAAAVVEKQIAYGKKRLVPWGISESAENVTDANLKYQYRSFGVPELGFKRGLADDLVIAPYATILALMVMPEEACANMKRLSALGFEGRFGFYEAIDYTQSRLSIEQNHALIRSFMAHHQGISFISLLNYFQDNIMQKRFVSDPLFKATVLLLQERVPKSAPYKSQPAEIERIRPVFEQKKEMLRIF
ncbi:MAG: cyclic beta 1-2 glucan synthetase, partial [Spirochaetaceae bacterium]